MENIYELLAYLIIYSFVGWILDTALRTYQNKKFCTGGYLHLPLCFIYGIPAIIMVYFYNNLKEMNIFILFFSVFIIFSIWEFIVGYFLEKLFNVKYWDYSKMKFNYKGLIALETSIIWGIVVILFVHFIHSFISNLISKIPENILHISIIIFTIIIVIDWIYSTIKYIKYRPKKLKNTC